MADPIDLTVTISAITKPFVDGISSLKTVLEDLTSAMANLGMRQAAGVRDSTESIVAEYKRRTEAIYQNAEAQRKAADDAYALSAKKPVDTSSLEKEKIRITEEQFNQLAEAQNDFQTKSTAQANRYAIETLQAEQDLAIKQIEAFKGYQNKMLEAGQQYRAASLGLEIAYRKKIEAITTDPTLTGKQIEKFSNDALEQHLKEQQALQQSYSLKFIDINKNQQLNQIKQDEQRARFANDKIALIKLEAKKEIIAREAVLQAEAVKANILTFNPDDEKESKAAIERWKAANIDAINTIEKEVNKLSEAEQKEALAVMNQKKLETLNQIAMSATTAGAAITAAFTAAIKPAMELEKALAAVAAVSGMKMKSAGMQELRAQAVDLATQFTYTATEVANGMKFLAQAGFSVPEIKVMSKDILDLAVAADLPLKDAFNIAATTIRGFKMEASDMSRVANVLTKAANMTNVEVSDLSESFKYAGPVAAAAGVEFEDVAAALGIMANAGIKGSMAGTALRQTISSLIAPTSQQRTMINELGLSITNASGNFVGFQEIVRQMGALFATSITDPAQQAGLAMKLFGDRAGPGMLAVINEGAPGLAKLSDAFKDTTESMSAAAVAAERMNNLTDSLTRFGTASKALSTTAFGGMLEYLTSLVNHVIGFVSWLNKVVETTPALKTIASVFLGIAGAAGLLFTAFGLLVGAAVGLNRVSIQLGQTGSIWGAIWGANVSNMTFGINKVQIATTGLTAKFGVLGSMASLVWTNITMRTDLAVGGFAKLRAAIEGVKVSVFSLQGAFLALQAATIIGLIITGWQMLGPIIDKIKAKMGFLNTETQDTTASMDSMVSAYQDLRKIDDMMRKSEDVQKNFPELNKYEVPELRKEQGKYVVSKEDVDNSLKSVSEIITGIKSEVEDLNTTTSKTSEEISLGFQKAWAKAGAVKPKLEGFAAFNKAVIDANKVTISNLEKDRNAYYNRQAQAEIIASSTTAGTIALMANKVTGTGVYDKSALKSLDEKQTKLVQQNIQLAKSITLVEGLNKVLIPTRMDIAVPDIKNLETTKEKLEEINKVYDESTGVQKDRIDLINYEAELKDKYLTKEQRDVNAMRRLSAAKKGDLEVLINKTRQYSEEGSVLYQKEKAAYEKTNQFIRDKILLSGKNSEEMAKITKETVATASGQENDWKKTRANAVALLATITSSYKKATDAVKAELAAQEKAHTEAFNLVRSLTEEQFQIQKTYIERTRALQVAAHGETVKESVAEMRRQVELAEQKVKLSRERGDYDQEQKDIKSLNDLQYSLGASTASKLKEAWDKLSQSQRDSIEARGTNINGIDRLTGQTQVTYTASAKYALEEKKKLEEIRRYKADGESDLKDFEALAKANQDFVTGMDDSTKRLLNNNKIRIEDNQRVADETSKAIKQLSELSATLALELSTATEKFTDVNKEHIKNAADFGVFSEKYAAAQKAIDDELAKKRELSITVKMEDESWQRWLSKLPKTLKLTPSNTAETGTGEVQGPLAKAAGGIIPGFGGGDIIPAMLEPGEFVIRKDSVRSFGASFFAALNNMAAPGLPSSLRRVVGGPRLAFASGGLVPGAMGGEKTTNLNLTFGRKTYQLVGRDSVVAALTEQMRREAMTT